MCLMPYLASFRQSAVERSLELSVEEVETSRKLVHRWS